jgi:probable rRNA maturation factor
MAGRSSESASTLRAGLAAASHPAPGLVVDIADSASLLTAAGLASLRAEALAAVAALRRSGEVRVRLVADSEMADAHLKFSKIPGTTDVLTFDLSEKATTRGEPFDVDILACVDEARRQAAARSLPVERELLLYILHGALHCLGFDDHDDAAFERMHAEEDRVLTAIGVGPIFHRASHQTGEAG